MKKINLILILLFLISAEVFSSERKVLVEIFTNSHCPLCPPAHSAIDNYLQSNNGSKIEFIYYHMIFPYSTDKLYQDNTEDASAKNNLYGPFSSTPQAFFNGTHVGNSYSNWSGSLDNLISEQSSFEISLSGNYSDTDFIINAEIKKTSDITENDVTANFVVVENVDYQGSNGIANHKNVMRKIENINGTQINLALNESKNVSSTFAINNLWNSDELKIIVYLQSSSTKKIYQAESINYSELTLTDISDNSNLPINFELFQNYPNPFNPTTTIKYSIPDLTAEFNSINNVSLKVFDILGNEISTLVNENKAPGKYEANFNSSELVSGIYFYKLQFGNFIEVKKMTFLK